MDLLRNYTAGGRADEKPTAPFFALTNFDNSSKMEESPLGLMSNIDSSGKRGFFPEQREDNRLQPLASVAHWPNLLIASRRWGRRPRSGRRRDAGPRPSRRSSGTATRTLKPRPTNVRPIFSPSGGGDLNAQPAVDALARLEKRLGVMGVLARILGDRPCTAADRPRKNPAYLRSLQLFAGPGNRNAGSGRTARRLPPG